METLILMLMLVVAMAALAAIQWQARPAVREPVCAACRAPVAAAVGFVCPGCKADWREAGLLTPHNTGPVFAAMGTLWTLGILVFGSCSSGIAMAQWGPHVMRSTSLTTFSGPRSGAYQSVTLDCRREQVSWGRHNAPTRSVDTTTLTLKTATGGLSMKVNYQINTGGWRAPDGRWVERGRVDTQALVAWMKDAGVDVAKPGVDQEAADLAAKVRAGPNAVANTSGFTGIAVTSSSGSGPHPGGAYAALAFWSLVWALGLSRIWRARRRGA